MNPRFDVFRKQSDRFIKWVGSAQSLEDLDRLILADSNASRDDYIIYRSAYGVTEMLRDFTSLIDSTPIDIFSTLP